MPKSGGYEGHRKTGVDRGQSGASLPKGSRKGGRSDGTIDGVSRLVTRQAMSPDSKSKGDVGAEPVDTRSLNKTDESARIQPINGAGTGKIGAQEVKK